MTTTWRLGRIFGVSIGLHYSWLLIAAWVFSALAGRFRFSHPGWESSVLWASAALTTLLFFSSLLAHELAHAAVAKVRGIPVRSITLFALGGIAQADREAADPGTEFSIAIAGPIASFFLGACSLAAAFFCGWRPASNAATPALSIAVWIGYINLWLALFNLTPAYPLDGGRVLRAAVWRLSGNREKSLRIAAQAGRAGALALIAFGVFRVMAGAGFGALWMCVVGLFILDAARTSYAHARILEALRGLRVRDLMARDCPTVHIHSNLRDLIILHMMAGNEVPVLVTVGSGAAGVVTPREVRGIPQQQWPYKTAGDVMLPLDETQAIHPETPVMEALERMGRANLAQVPVSEGGQLAGIFSRSSVLCFLQSRAR